MAWTYGFFNSLNGDRKYNAAQHSEIFTGLLSDGVYESVGEKLAVQANSGMTIQIGTGRGWFFDRWVKNDAKELLTLEDSDVLLNRYCAVCVRVDKNTETRSAVPYLKYSEFATTPVKPSMERAETVKEFCLAYVYIAAGATEITAADIEDTRGNAELCGWVTGLIKQVDTTTLWEQFRAQWQQFMAGTTAWLETLQSYLDEDTEAKMAADILDLENKVVKSSGVFDGLGWDSQDDGTYLQTITVQGVRTDNDIMVAPTDEYRDAYNTMGCEAIAQGLNTVTFRCTDPDDINMEVGVIIFNLTSGALMASITQSGSTLSLT